MILQFPQKSKIEQPHDPAVLRLGIKRNEHICLHKDLNMNIHQQQLPWQSEYGNNSYAHERRTGKQNGIHPYNGLWFGHSNILTLATRLNLENMVLSERSQTQKVIDRMIPCIWTVQNMQICRAGKQISGCREPGKDRERSGEWLLMGKGFLLGVMKIFHHWVVVMAAQLSEYAKNYGTVCFKEAEWIGCGLSHTT